MSVVLWRSLSKLACSCEEGASVIVCLNSLDRLTSHAPFIEGTIVNFYDDFGPCLEPIYGYGIEYDSSLLADPSNLLNAGDISGVTCRGCLTTYIDYQIQIAVQNALGPR